MGANPTTPTSVLAGLGRQSIRVQFAALVLVAALPVFLLSVWQQLQQRDRDRDMARDHVRLLVDGTANRLQASLDDYAGTLSLIANQPRVRAMDTGGCDPLIDGFVRLHPEFVTIGTRDLQGNAICTYLKNPPGSAQMRSFPWFEPAVSAGQFHVSDAFLAPLAGRWVTVLSAPVRDAAQVQRGIVVLPLDLQELNQLTMKDVSQGSTTLVLDRQQRILLRSSDAAQWVAKPLSRTLPGLAAQLARQPSAVSMLVDAAGVPQLVAYRQLSSSGWTVISMMPQAAVFSAADRTLQRSVVISIVLLGLALLLAWRLARGIIFPLEAMAAITSRVAAGDRDVRMPVYDGVPEIVALERAFKRMVQARNLVELALRENESSLSLTLQSIGDAVIATDLQGRITRMNPAAERLTGWPLGEALTQPLNEVFRIRRADGGDAIDPVRTVLQTGDVVGLAQGTELQSRDGRQLQIADSAAPIRDAEGVVVGVVLVFSDVTAQYVAQRELRETFNFLRQVIDNLPLGLYVLDLQGRFVEWNPAMAQLRGQARDEMLGRTLEEAITPHSPERYSEVKDAVARALRGEQVERPQRPVVGSNPPRWTTIRHSPVRNAQGAVTGTLSIIQDVTDRMRVEKALRESEENLAITLRSIGDAVMATDIEGVITRMNPMAERLTGWTLAQALGRPLVDVFRIVNAVTRETPVDPVARVLETGQVVGLANHTALVARDGSECQIYDSAAPIRDADDRMVGVVLVFSDVTEQYRLQQVLVESEERYRALVELSPVGVVVHVDEKLVFANPAALHMLGADNEQQVLGRNIREFVHSRLHDLIDARAEAVKSDQTVFPTQDWRYLRLDGKTVDVQAQASVIRLDGRSAVQVGFMDITERKRAQEQLRENEARFRALTSLSSDWYWEQDEEFRFVRVTGADGDWTEAAGDLYPNLDYIGKRRWELGTTQLTSAQWEQHRRVLESHQEFRDLELRFTLEGGGYRWASVSGMPIIDNEGRFRGYRGIGRDITQHKLAQEQINALAFYDALTELPNRRMLIEQLKRALLTHARNQHHAALLFIDLDNFKTLNDTLGHETGDLLLQQVARRLLACVREADSVARLGGDEFVVMLQGLSVDALEAAADAEQVGHKILDAFAPQFLLADREYRSTPSIGITLFGNGSQGVDDLLKQADLAMYQAKAAGRNTMRMFDQGMQAAVDARAAMESDIRAALVQSQFALHYQPVVNRGGMVTGAEALVRWRHPTRGQIPPGQFIPLAESTGLIVPLGRWVLDTACRQIAAWREVESTRHLTLAVNVSAHQFKAPDFVAQVLAALERQNADPARLKLELTESLLAENVEDVVEKMTALRARGVDFSLDDFGTGYSSLSYLKRLPLSHLKIDQSFVRDLLVDANDAAIARTIVALGASLGLAVIAEGVETQGQLAMLQSMGCEAFQGYLFARPVAIDEFDALLPGPLPAVH
jgi:diguanylate cyclase (GGDEF)-like protein/PAS domain S-box-containing protein